MQRVLLLSSVFVLLCACGQHYVHTLVASNSGWYLDRVQIESTESLESQLKNIRGKSVLIASCAKTKHQLVADTLNMVSESSLKARS